ncbi:hypothetical protein MYCGRDRAFT_94912 [Lecanosticta acicola]|uniref:non-specific serine/threonine protein kinase n=1 Tax=Lecanosticta acicola TaxID=111012 RepID=A0AAI8YT23_9PEZI|nr:hypothetical protein MYCGRDRAFT_94912 [Lecanosticta acicola]
MSRAVSQPGATSTRSTAPVPATGGIAQTPRETIGQLVKEQEEAYKKQGLHEYAYVKPLTKSSEGELAVHRSVSTGKQYVVKHTFAFRIPGSRHREPVVRPYPNESWVLHNLVLPHPNIVQIYETTRDRDESGRFKIWMEMADGGDLHDQLNFWYVKKRSWAPEVFLLHVIVEMMQALAYLHHGLRGTANGKWTQDEVYNSVIHGDIKLENVLLRWTEIPIGGLPDIVLGDFGAARLAGDTETDLLPGTTCFHAPEDRAITGGQRHTKETEELYVKASANRTIAADMYSFGQIVYMLASKEFVPREIGKDPSDIRLCRDFDMPEVRELIVRCLAVDPNERAQASFDETVGILPLVERVRKARDERIRTRFPLDSLEWKNPPPRRMRRFRHTARLSLHDD